MSDNNEEKKFHGTTEESIVKSFEEYKDKMWNLINDKAKEAPDFLKEAVQSIPEEDIKHCWIQLSHNTKEKNTNGGDWWTLNIMAHSSASIEVIYFTNPEEVGVNYQGWRFHYFD